MAIKEIKYRSQSFVQTLLDKTSDLLKSAFNHIIHPGERLLTVYLLTIVAILCFGYTLVTHNFTIPLGGDYTLQEMTFLFNGYDDWHTFFRTGAFPTWDRSVFLGIDNIGGNSFYYLFDPFFLLYLIFPRDWLLVLQGLSFIPKTVIAGMFFYWYLGSFNFSPKTRRIGALCYAFSAYTFSYLWFHFLDSVVFLPLVFLGLERIIKNRDPRIFLVAFLLNAMVSYFFFVVFMFGAFFYAIYRYFQTIKTRDVEDNIHTLICGFISFVIAVLLGCFTLLPGITTAQGMPRVSSSSYLDNILSATGIKEKLAALFSYGTNNHNQVTPLLNFLFMYDDCYSSNLLNISWYDNYVAGLYATTPLLLLFFVSLIDSLKQKKVSHFVGLLFTAFLVFTPVGFYLFSGFTVGYARYFIIPISWMIVFDLKALERRRNIPRNYLDLSFVITALLMLVSCFLMIFEVNLQPSHFNDTEWDLKMVLIPASLLWLTICYFVMRKYFHQRKFSKAIFLLSSLDIIVMANLTIQCQGLTTTHSNSDITEESKIVELLKKSESDNDYYRIYNTTADRGNINISLREGYNGLGAFHSVYAYETQNFLDRSRIPYSYHNWSMGIHNRRYNLETFLGTKYYLVDRVDFDNYTGYATPPAYPHYQNGNYTWAGDYDIPYGYKDITILTESEIKEMGIDYSSELIDYLKSDECSKSLYVNLNFVDFAFAYDQVVNEWWLATNLAYKDDDADPYYNCYEDENEYPLLRAAMLDNEDYQKFYKEGKYNAGTYTLNGHTLNIEGASSLSAQSTLFRTSQVTSSKYVEGVTAPMEVYAMNYSTNKLKATVYAANWPATSSTPSGEYAECDTENAYDRDCLNEYKKTNPWEYQNGIRPADTVYEFNSHDKLDVLYNTKIVIEPVDRNGNVTPLLPEADPSDPTTGGYISIFDTQNIEWRLFDKDNKVISFAKHSYSEYKQAHGYYADRPVYKILGILKEGTKADPIRLKEPIIYVSRNKDYQNAIDKLKKEPIEIVSRVDSEVVFKTNYSNDKFVVLNYPKTDGWKLYEAINGNEVPVTIYKAQGGFIGFEGNSGEHKYILRYSSPNFETGVIFTSIGMIFTLLALVYYTKKNKYLHEFDEYITIKKKRDEYLQKEIWDYANFEDKIQ